MANIADDAAFEALLIASEARYADITDTVIQGGAVDMTDRFIFSTPALGSDNNASSFTARNCFINMVSGTSLGNYWRGGDLTIENSTINYSGGSANFEWPGFAGVANATLADYTSRPILDFSNSTILSSRASGMTLHLQGARPTGAHDFNNMTLGAGVAPIAIFGMTDWVGVTFSGHAVNSNTSLGGRLTNFRFDHPGQSGGFRGNVNNPGLISARWMGFFGCDFSAWVANDVVNLNNGTASNSFTWNRPPTADLPQMWVVDGTYSNQITTNGIQFGSNLGNVDVRTGISFNPRFRNSSSATLEQITDVIVDFGTVRPAYLGMTTKDNTAYPVQFNTSAMTAIRTVATDNGYVIQTGTPNTDQSTLANGLVPIPTNAGVTIACWSYTNKSYNNQGMGMTSVPTAQIFTDGFVLDATSTQNIDLEAEVLLNNRNKSDAETLIVNGVSDLQDAFPVAKSLYFDGRHTNFSPFGSTQGTFSLGTNNAILTQSGSSSLVDGGDFTIQTGGLLDLSGLTFNGGTLSASDGEHVLQQGVVGFTNVNMSGLSFGNGVIIAGGTFTNIDADNFDNTNSVTFTGNPTLNIEGLTSITDWNTSGGATITADNPVMLAVTSAQNLALTAGTNVQFVVEPVTYRFAFDNPGFRGRAAIVHRTSGTTDAWTYTTIHDFTTTAPNLPDIDSNHAGFTTPNQQVAVVTVGAAYTLTFTTLDAPQTGFVGTINVTVRTTFDQLWNETASANLPAGATMDIEGLVTQGDSDGSVAIVVRGSTPDSFLTTQQTNGLLGLARNDVDYITELLDGGRNLDFITFRQDTGGSTVDSTFVQFRKRDADPQQVVSDVQGFMSRTVSGVADVLNYPNVQGISTTDIITAVNVSTPGRIIVAAQTSNSGFLKANSPRVTEF